jgi:hypothetical protein
MTINNPIIKDIGGGYVLKTPLNITIASNVINTMKDRYIPNGETGGLMWLRAAGNSYGIIDRVTFLPNLSGLATGYSTSQALFNSTVNNILGQNYLPVVFHSHPVTLGLSLYDSRNPNFYLRSSAADRKLSRDTIIEGVPLYMPEVIFVKSQSYSNGYAMSAYGGQVLPVGFSRLSPLQIAAIGLGVYLYSRGELNSIGLIAVSSVILYGEYLRPNYEYTSDGGFSMAIK